MPRDDGRRVAPGETPLTGNTQVARNTPRTSPGHVLDDADAHSEIIDALARGDLSIAELARRHTVTRSAIYLFRNRHADEIEARREELGHHLAELTNLWMADKHARLRELEGIYERLAGMFDGAGPDDAPELARTLISVLHEAAEQLGQLPARVQVQSMTVVRYELPGVDMEQL